MPKLPGSFQPLAKLPIDDRTVAATITDRDAIENKYDGLVVYVTETKTRYLYKDNEWQVLPDNIVEELKNYGKVFKINYPGGLNEFYENDYQLIGSLPNDMTAQQLYAQGYNIIRFIDSEANLTIQFTMSQINDEMMMGNALVPNSVKVDNLNYMSVEMVILGSVYMLTIGKGSSLQVDLTLGAGYVTDVQTLNHIRDLYKAHNLVYLRVNNAVTFVPAVCYDDWGTQGLLGFITDQHIVKYTWDYNADGTTQVTPTMKVITTEDSLTLALTSYALKQTTSPYYSYKYSPTSPYFTKVNASGENVDTISTDISLSIDEVPASNPYSILYEYFRITVLQMRGHYGPDGNIIQDGPITATAQFIPGNNMYTDLGLSSKLQSWFVYSITAADSLIANGPTDLDSFKVELLGGPYTAAECTMIITAYTKQSESYELQIVATAGNYISKGWVKKDYHNYATTDYVDNAIPDQVQFATYLGDNNYGGWQLYLSKIDESHRNNLDSSWSQCPVNLQPTQLDPGTYLAIVDVVNSQHDLGYYCTSYTDIITITAGLGAGGQTIYHGENCTGKVHAYCSYRYESPYRMSSIRLQSESTNNYNIIHAFVSEQDDTTMTYNLMFPSTQVFNKQKVSCRVWIKKIISPSWDLPTE